MKEYTFKFKDLQGEKTVFMNQRDLAIFMLEFNRNIEIISVQPKKRRNIRKEQAE